MTFSKESLKKNQPVAWKILSNALQNGRLSHAILLTGPKSAPKSQLALLIAQSLVCLNPDEEGFACQSCAGCIQAEENANADLIWKKRTEPAGSEKKGAYRIKKGDIAAIQEQFSTGAVGPRANQVYILENYEAATPEASNSLLKFLEEPKDGLVGILTADETGTILPTILSRVQQITLRPASADLRKKELEDFLQDPKAAAMFANSGFSLDTAAPYLELEEAQTIREAAEEFWDHLEKPDALYQLQSALYGLKNFKQNKTAVRLLFFWLLYFNAQAADSFSASQLAIRKILLHGLDQISRPVDLMLLIDQTFFKIRQEQAKARNEKLRQKFGRRP